MSFLLRKYQPDDASLLRRLFYETVHEVNRLDYTPAQLLAWAPGEEVDEPWRARLAANDPYVCLVGEIPVGFADVQPSGHIDMFFVHFLWQRQGVGRRLMQAIHAEALARGLPLLTSDVSTTARPFFEAHGFRVVARQQVWRDETSLENFRMVRLVSRD